MLPKFCVKKYPLFLRYIKNGKEIEEETSNFINIHRQLIDLTQSFY